MRLRLTLKSPKEGQDNFFLWSMVVLPILAESAYIYDAYADLSRPRNHHYSGLFSTLLVVFTYLRYCAPIESYKMLGLYYILLCILNEAGTVGYIIGYIQHKNTYNTVIYVLWGVLELIMTGCLIYYRVIRRCHPNFHLESEHLFKFISRLEVILAIFIPFFYSDTLITLTKHSIAFFLLFDFFSESYNRFQGCWIKSILYLFVCTVTTCVATEWIYLYQHESVFEKVSSTSEFVSACLCDTLIIFQFIPHHFKTLGISEIARTALLFQRKFKTDLLVTEAGLQLGETDIQITEADLKTVEIIAEPILPRVLSRDTIIEVKF